MLHECKSNNKRVSEIISGVVFINLLPDLNLTEITSCMTRGIAFQAIRTFFHSFLTKFIVYGDGD